MRQETEHESHPILRIILGLFLDIVLNLASQAIKFASPYPPVGISLGLFAQIPWEFLHNHSWITTK